MVQVLKGMRVSLADIANGTVEEVERPISVHPGYIDPGGCIVRIISPTTDDLTTGLTYHLLGGACIRLRFEDVLEWDAYAVEARIDWPNGTQPLVHFLFNGPPIEVRDG